MGVGMGRREREISENAPMKCCEKASLEDLLFSFFLYQSHQVT